ncbi:hypothetical protein [Chitinophaga sp.]|uniref:hypothetical protein n=1 Tax=Chitinophaga sp. TaxID=1869181 RepID=UPI0031DBCFDE
MRSFITFMVCTGFIIWAHSCDKRIVGVKIYGHGPDSNPGQDGLAQKESRSPAPIFIANAANRHYADSILLLKKDLFILR